VRKALLRVSRYEIVSLLILGSSICSTAFAAGFYISEVGTPGSLGSAGVINPTNTYSADAAWTNPAGMTGLDDEDRSFDLPFDEVYKLAASYSWRGDKQFDYAIASTLYFYGDAAIDQTQQGVRAKGEFDTNVVVFVGATMNYRF
jgi:long-subunit fatty acid transport protein